MEGFGVEPLHGHGLGQHMGPWIIQRAREAGWIVTCVASARFFDGRDVRSCGDMELSKICINRYLVREAEAPDQARSWSRLGINFQAQLLQSASLPFRYSTRIRFHLGDAKMILLFSPLEVSSIAGSYALSFVLACFAVCLRNSDHDARGTVAGLAMHRPLFHKLTWHNCHGTGTRLSEIRITSDQSTLWTSEVRRLSSYRANPHDFVTLPGHVTHRRSCRELL